MRLTCQRRWRGRGPEDIRAVIAGIFGDLVLIEDCLPCGELKEPLGIPGEDLGERAAVQLPLQIGQDRVPILSAFLGFGGIEADHRAGSLRRRFLHLEVLPGPAFAIVATDQYFDRGNPQTWSHAWPIRRDMMVDNFRNWNRM